MRVIITKKMPSNRRPQVFERRSTQNNPQGPSRGGLMVFIVLYVSRKWVTNVPFSVEILLPVSANQHSFNSRWSLTEMKPLTSRASSRRKLASFTNRLTNLRNNGGSVSSIEHNATSANFCNTNLYHLIINRQSQDALHLVSFDV